MRVLVTGGLGFVGGRLGCYLNTSGVQVRLGTRQEKTHPPEWLPEAEVLQMNWDNASSLERACKGVDVVVHSAGMNASECSSSPAEALMANGCASAKLLYSAISANVNKFLYISTGHVYNSPLQGNITESTCPENLHPYASSHRAGEDAVRYAHQRQLIHGIVIRLSNGYGAPTRKEVNCWMLLVNDLCRQAVETGKMVLQSSGSQLRDFIPMTSVCKIIQTLIAGDSQPGSDEVYNVGNGQSMSVLEMANMVKERCEVVLGRQIPLLKTSKVEKCVEFQYNIERLRIANINYEIDHEHEIDTLVQFCVQHFS
jgi:UDP-glucose 4-epimerase